MKNKKLFCVAALLSASMSVFAFNTENRTDHILYVFDGTSQKHDHFRYEEEIHSHHTSHGWLVNEAKYICAEWSNHQFPGHRSCCLVKPHSKQIVTGNIKDGLKADCN